MFTLIFQLALFCFAVWTMSIPGTECYIAPGYWVFFVFAYWFCTHPMHNRFPKRR